MHIVSPRPCWVSIVCSAYLLLLAPQAHAQVATTRKLPLVAGTVCDEQSRPLDGAEVTLEGSDAVKMARSTTDEQGHFQFDGLPTGTYRLRAKREGYRSANEGPFVLEAVDAKVIVLHLAILQVGPTSNHASAELSFSDEPQFTVAGVTDTSALGVHASSRNMPNSNALAKDTAALTGDTVPPSEEAAIRAKLAAADDPQLRFQLAELEERGGRALDAAKDYQRTAELDPTEAHLFSWGAELLLHRAFEPAVEVFHKGHRKYPASVRMLLGLGAADYAQGSREEAAQFFVQASDLEPPDPQPYLFLGRLLETENSPSPGWIVRMERFALLHSENATAHYLYGLALAKQGEKGSAEAAEAELKRALEFDPRLAKAYLQLGILYAARNDSTRAVTAFQKAVECAPELDEGHYRLAEVYRRMGEAEKARQETALYKQVAAQKAQEEERERREVQQFIYTLRSPGVPAQDPADVPARKQQLP